MVEIHHKKLEIEQPEALDSRFAVFIIEFGYDNKVYIGHTIIRTVKQALKKFIANILDESVKRNEALRESMQKSDVLYITIKEPASYSLDELFKLKYDLVSSCGSYEPFGYNILATTGNRPKEEKKYIELLREQVGPIYKQSISTNAQPIKEYHYNKISKEYKLVAEWPSITAAAQHYNLRASNIASCCAGRIHTAYGRIWRYSNNY